MRFFRFHLTAVLALLPGTLLAQSNTMTLEEATKIALERNLSVVQAQNNIDAADAALLSARGSWLPTLSASGNWNRSQQESKGVTTQIINGIPIVGSASRSSSSFNTGINAGWTIFDGLSRENSNAAASSRVQSTEYVYQRTRQSIAYGVFAAYMNVLRNEQLVKVTEENLKRDRRQLERIVESNRVGSLSIADVYRQQSTVASDELSVINAQNTFDKAKADLLALIGVDLYKDYVFADPSISISIDTLEMKATVEKYSDYNSMVQRALKARPDYLSSMESVNQAQAALGSARSSYFPRISASAGYGLNGNQLSQISNNQSLSWGVGISWSLFDGFRTNSSIQSADVSKRNAEIALAQAGIGVSVDVKKAILDLDAARKSLEVSQKGVTSATQDRAIAEERYNLGAGTLLDLLTANASLVQAQANLVNNFYGYHTAKYNVEYVLGERQL
jgi:outer membrane protein